MMYLQHRVDENSESRLEWYDYDLSVHQMCKVDYVVNDSNVFTSYNSLVTTILMTSGFISFIISNLGDEISCNKYENLIKAAPCLILQQWKYLATQ